MHRPIRVCAVLILATLLPAGASTAHEGRVSLCRSTQLALTNGPGVSSGTGQNLLDVRLSNRSRVACVLNGYPVVSFSDRRGTIPFVIRDGGGHGGDQQVTLNAPRRLLILPGRSAYVLLNKYRCDLGSLRVATRMRLALPASPAKPVGSLSLNSAGYSYCKRVATFNIVSVSPFVPSVVAGQRRF